jgi:Oxidoreductase family, NAD-binding Rossmann fold
VSNPGAVGLIGLGEIGQVHAAGIRLAPAAWLAAVADTEPDRLRPYADEGVRAYREAGELIADAQVGTVSVCLPHHLHFPVALQAIRAGKNVLVEKPLAIGQPPRAARDLRRRDRDHRHRRDSPARRYRVAVLRLPDRRAPVDVP